MSKLQEVADLTERGKAKLIGAAVQGALDEGTPAPEILNTMIDAMGVVGEKFKRNEIFVPEMLVAARAMKKGVEILKPHLAGDNTVSAGKLIIGTVAGDLHDIGKNLVAMMLESAGFEVIDLGVDVSGRMFQRAIKEHPEAEIVCISSLLTTSMPGMRQIVKQLKRTRGFHMKIMVGGGSITQEFADEIGADAYTTNAVDAVDVAKRFVQHSDS